MHKMITRLMHSTKRFSFLLLLIAAPSVFANSPYLAFSDIVSGPDTGLGDGKGSGVIVTLWGQKLGGSQGSSNVYFTDSSGTKHEVAYIYYWKNADGTLPSGPANLYESHQMQEIAISIPDSASGRGSLTVEVGGKTSNALSFTVREGGIYHVTSSGSDNGNGSWDSPWRTIDKADSTAPAGSTIYVHDVDTGSTSSSRGIYWSNADASSSLDAQFSIIAYPGFQPKVTAQNGVEGYNTEGLVVSKLDIYSSNYRDVSSTGQPTGGTVANGRTAGISSTKNGRAVANRIGDMPGGCASMYQGAISGTAKFGDNVSNFKILGNEIYDYGCEGSSKLHHTTYMTVRSDGANTQVAPWEFGFNYLHGNKAKFGIHQFDQNEGCGDLTGTLRIYKNVIVDQGGAGISVGSQCGWSMDVEIENNLLINVGLAADWDGIDPNTTSGPENGGIAIRDSGLTGTIYVENNTILGHTEDGQGPSKGGRGCLNFNGTDDNVRVVWNNNICYSEVDVPFVGAGYKADNKLNNVSGSNNVWFYRGSSPEYALVPSWDSAKVTQDPLIRISGVMISADTDSALLDNGVRTDQERDLYGNLRVGTTDIGAVELSELKSPPNPPPSVNVSTE